MAGTICQRLINKVWRRYTNDLEEVENEEGIYVIGKEWEGDVTYWYIGHSNDIKRRLQEHKRQSLYIDELIQAEFQENGGANLRIKWVFEPNSRRNEGQYESCLEGKLGYELCGNIKRGNYYQKKKNKLIIDSLWIGSTTL